MLKKKINADVLIVTVGMIGLAISLYIDRNEYMAFAKAAYTLSLMFLTLGLKGFFILYRYIKSGFKEKPAQFWQSVFFKFIQAALFLFLSINILIG